MLIHVVRQVRQSGGALRGRLHVSQNGVKLHNPDRSRALHRCAWIFWRLLKHQVCLAQASKCAANADLHCAVCWAGAPIFPAETRLVLL